MRTVIIRSLLILFFPLLIHDDCDDDYVVDSVDDVHAYSDGAGEDESDSYHDDSHCRCRVMLGASPAQNMKCLQYLPTYLPSYQPTNLPTDLPIRLLTDLPTEFPTCLYYACHQAGKPRLAE